MGWKSGLWERVSIEGTNLLGEWDAAEEGGDAAEISAIIGGYVGIGAMVFLAVCIFIFALFIALGS